MHAGKSIFVELGIYVTYHVFLCLTSVIIVYMTTTRPIRRIMVQTLDIGKELGTIGHGISVYVMVFPYFCCYVS